MYNLFEDSVPKCLLLIECDNCGKEYLEIGWADELSYGGEYTKCVCCGHKRRIRVNKDDKLIAKLQKLNRKEE